MNPPIDPPAKWRVSDRRLTSEPCGHVLTNIGCWSHDGDWIVFDRRSDPAGSVFDSVTIARVHVRTGEVQEIYRAKDHACVGVVTCSPVDARCVFIHGPEHPTADWQYAPHHRRGVIVDPGIRRANPRESLVNLEACCVSPPLIRGALRGGTHVHTFDARGEWVAFTYEDHLLSIQQDSTAERNQRNIGIAVPGHPVSVHAGHPRNHSGTHFAVLVSKTWDQPVPGSDQIQRAYEDAWIGRHGYVASGGQRQERALACFGDVVDQHGRVHTELFVIDLPQSLLEPGDDGPLEGTLTRRPCPPRGVVQRRLTFTSDRPDPGIQGVRHWPRSDPEGEWVACLMRDGQKASQLWLVSPRDGSQRQLTRLPSGVESAFSVSPDGRWIAHVSEQSPCVTRVDDGITYRLTARCPPGTTLRPEACVFSPCGRKVAYVQGVLPGEKGFNQVHVVSIDGQMV